MNAWTQFRWSVRRELWENRSIYIGPLVIAALALVGFLFTLAQLPRKVVGLSALDPVKQVIVAVTPYSIAASVILLTCWVVAVIYCLDTFTSERRDRSILFWKSMPVSDLLTVLSKVSITLVVLPLFGCAIVLATQLVMLLVSTVVLFASGVDARALWGVLPLVEMPLAMFYGMAVHSLWFSPILAWLLLVSAGVRRVPMLWAFVPFFAIYVVETLGFGTKYMASFLKYRLTGAMGHAFEPDALRLPITRLSQLEPMGFLGAPGLWLGLAFAAACIAGAIRLRRYREPN